MRALRNFLIFTSMLGTSILGHAQMMSTDDILVVGAASSRSKYRKKIDPKTGKPFIFNLKTQQGVSDFVEHLNKDGSLSKLKKAYANFIKEYEDEKEDELKDLIEDYELNFLRIKLNLNFNPGYGSVGHVSCPIEISAKTDKLAKVARELNRKILKIKDLTSESATKAFLDEITWPGGPENLQYEEIKSFYESYDPNKEYILGYEDKSLCIDGMGDYLLGYFKTSALEKAIEKVRDNIDNRLDTYNHWLERVNSKYESLMEDDKRFRPLSLDEGKENINDSERDSIKDNSTPTQIRANQNGSKAQRT